MMKWPSALGWTCNGLTPSTTAGSKFQTQDQKVSFSSEIWPVVGETMGKARLTGKQELLLYPEAPAIAGTLIRFFVQGRGTPKSLPSSRCF